MSARSGTGALVKAMAPSPPARRITRLLVPPSIVTVMYPYLRW